MATDKFFLTFTMHRFINAAKDAVNLHQESFGYPFPFGIVALQFLMNPYGNLQLYASITKLVTSTIANESTTTPESLAMKWFNQDGLLDEGNPFTVLCASSMWFLRFFLSFEDYDHAVHHSVYKITSTSLLLISLKKRRIECDVFSRMVALQPFNLAVLARSDGELFDEFALIPFSGNLEDVKEAFQSWSAMPGPTSSLIYAHVRELRHKIETSLDTRTVYLDSLASGLIRHSLLNQGESTSAGYAKLIAMCVGVPVGRKLKLLSTAYDNLERLHEFYARRYITDAPLKVRRRLTDTVSQEVEQRDLAIVFGRMDGEEPTTPVRHQPDAVPLPEAIVDEANIIVAGLENRVEHLGEVVALELGDEEESGVGCAAGVYVDGEPVRPCQCHRVRGTRYCWFHRRRTDVFRQEEALPHIAP